MSIILGSMTFWLAVIVGVGMLLVSYLHIFRHEKLRCRNLLPASKNNYPPTAVIMAVKGVSLGLKENICAILEQDHPDLEFIFSVETKEDPAHLFIEEILADFRQHQPEIKTRLVVAGINFDRAQKITNQLAAVARVEENTQYLVFLDVDILPRKDYIRYLLMPLMDPNIGATTGYRWYQPDRPGFSSMLCSTWNAGAFLAMTDPALCFAWGGTMAIRRETFVSAGISKAWQHSVSDDLSLTHAVKRQGLKIHYVPECVPITYESPNLRQTVEFTSRQMLMARVYHPVLWWVMSIVHPALMGIILFGLGNLVLWLLSGDNSYLSGVGGLVLLPFLYASTYWMIEVGRKWMPEISQSVHDRRWYYTLMAPFASMLSTHNSIKNLFTRKITWHGIDYELVSPEKTIVTRPKDVTYGDGTSVSR